MPPEGAVPTSGDLPSPPLTPRREWSSSSSTHPCNGRRLAERMMMQRGLAILLIQAAVCTATCRLRSCFASRLPTRAPHLRPAQLHICSPGPEDRSEGVWARCEQKKMRLIMCERKDDAGTGIAGKAAWVAAEALGNAARVLGATPQKQGESRQEESDDGKIDRQEALARLRADYDRDYFISGEVDSDLYDEDCLFADPFASFRGRDRFINNLQNLGTFVCKSDCRLLSFEETNEEPLIVKTRVLVKLQLKLPWDPVLSWPWGVEHVYNPETGRIAEHIESWEIAPIDGVMQVFRKGPPGGLKTRRNGEGTG